MFINAAAAVVTGAETAGVTTVQYVTMQWQQQ